MAALAVFPGGPMAIQQPIHEMRFHLALGALFGARLIARVVRASGINVGDEEETLAIRRPSFAVRFRGDAGDAHLQVSPSASVEMRVTCFGSLPSGAIVQTCELPPRSLMKAMRFPSGDQRGRVFCDPSRVICVGAPPEMPMLQICVGRVLAARFGAIAW